MDPPLTTFAQTMLRANMADDDIEDVAQTFFEVADEAERVDRKRGGSRPGRSANLERDREAGAARIYLDYFSDNPVYGDRVFRRRFRMRRELFKRVVDGVTETDPYFEQKYDALGRAGLSTLQKAVAVIRILAYGLPADAVDEYVRIGESTAAECTIRFCEAVVERFGPEYLRSPTVDDLRRIMDDNARRNFPGMAGSIDCYHWVWKNCPKAWQGQFRGAKGTSMILEAVAGHDLWIWHMFFGPPGTLNDINVLHRSPFLSALIDGSFPSVEYRVNGHTYTVPYWLADGIYPDWQIFVKSIPDPQGPARRLFTKLQEAARKDIERAFGVLQARFAIIRYASLYWKREVNGLLMTAAVILHNMIVEDERHDPNLQADLDFLPNENRPPDPMNPEPYIVIRRHPRPEALPQGSIVRSKIERYEVIRDKGMHYNLEADLVRHIWNNAGGHL
ncbi:DDE Tnp4 domain-containing protein [Plasmodiophora brassicae]|uniref:DDE Tnp4 domain-containing protein n=1 Tax=Plasmodiophora brassicae TaxID=37360 RepID=A0A0G4IXE6_PLABS|nr:hypothetical protein PBRA_007518 [Plasmodiophora brassicae]